jgi:flavin-dependent dehydrogenase
MREPYQATMIPSLRHDALIAGGGPSGSALAIALARAGRQVLLIERSREAQHKVCGEFLSPESLPLLCRLGIHPEALGARTIHSLRIAARDVFAEIALPAPALSLTRRSLDEALLLQAKQAGANLLRGYVVEQLVRHADWETHGLWRAQIANASNVSLSVHGRNAFLATGKHDLRGWQRSTQGTQHTLVALKMYFALTREQQAELDGHVELLLYPGGYAGLQPVENDAVNLCALITREKLQLLGSRWEHLLDHMQHHSLHLARRLAGAKPLLDRPLALSAIPYGFRVGTRTSDPSPWRLGDQAAVIPSFCGDGMAIALHSAQRASELYLAGSTSQVFHEEIRRQFSSRLDLATTLSRAMIAAPMLAHVLRLWPQLLSEIFAATRLPGTRIQAASNRIAHVG